MQNAEKCKYNGNDSPKDFIRAALITLVIVTVWGLVMGIMGEYR